MNNFSENGLGEPEQDANSALTELDKGELGQKQEFHINKNCFQRFTLWKGR